IPDVHVWSHFVVFFFSSRRRHTRFSRDWSSDVCSSDLNTILLLVLASWELTPMTPTPAARLCLPWSVYPTFFASTGGKPTNSSRSEERRVGKECRSRRSPSH